MERVVEVEAGSQANAEYRPRRPEGTGLYRLLIDHFETFLAERRDGPDPERGYLRPEVQEALESLLECGVLRFGFARLQSDGAAPIASESRVALHPPFE